MTNLKEDLAARARAIVEPHQNQEVTPEMKGELAKTVARLLRDYTITLAKRGLIGDEIPFKVGEISAAGGQIGIPIIVDREWLASAPPDVREELGAVMSATFQAPE